MRTPLRLFAAAIVLVVLAAACGPTVATNSAATVNGTVITRTQLEDAVRELVGDVESMSAEEREQEVGLQQRQILTMLITAQILQDAARDAGVEVTEADLDEVREEVIVAVGGEEELEPAVEGAGMTMDIFENVWVVQQAHLNALRDSLLGDETVETRTVRHILVEEQDLADDLVAQLDDGAEFGELAMEHSMDPGSGEAGGDLGPATRGQYVPEFDEAAWNADIGEVVGPVETQFGFHIIEVTDEASMDASELGPEQVEQMVGPEFSEILEAAFDEAEITIGAGLGEWDPATRQVVAEGEVGDQPPPADVPEEPQPDDAEEQ